MAVSQLAYYLFKIVCKIRDPDAFQIRVLKIKCQRCLDDVLFLLVHPHNTISVNVNPNPTTDEEL